MKKTVIALMCLTLIPSVMIIPKSFMVSRFDEYIDPNTKKFWDGNAIKEQKFDDQNLNKAYNILVDPRGGILEGVLGDYRPYPQEMCPVNKLFEWGYLTPENINLLSDEGKTLLDYALKFKVVKKQGRPIGFGFHAWHYNPEAQGERIKELQLYGAKTSDGSDIVLPSYDLKNAADEGDEERCRELIAQGANVDSQNPEGRSPLSYAILNGFVNIIKLLLDSGAHTNIQNETGETLFFSVFKSSQLRHDSEKRKQIIKMLLDAGGNPFLKNKYGKTVLDYVEEHKERLQVTQEEIALLEGAMDLDINSDQEIQDALMEEVVEQAVENAMQEQKDDVEQQQDEENIDQENDN